MPTFHVPNRIEISYRRSIFKILQKSIPGRLSEVGPDEWLSRLEALSDNPNLVKSAENVAERLVHDTNLNNAHYWRELARESHRASHVARYLNETRRGSIGRALRDQSDESAELIFNLPYRISSKIRREVDMFRKQGAPERVVTNLVRRRFSSLLNARIKLLARTDPHRINSALSKARSEDLELNCFIWQTTGDTVVRISHRRMNGVVVFWRELPSPEALVGLPPNLGHYAPGDCPNCRCIPIPVFSIEDLNFGKYQRLEVYNGGRIKKLTQAQFLRVAA